MLLRTARWAALILLQTLIGPPLAIAETPDPPVPLFSSNELVELRLDAPWRRLQREPEERGPYAARLHLLGASDGGGPTTLPLTVEKRGVTRQELCSMPPIRLRFDEDEVEGSLFEGNRSIKLVTHCKSGSRWEQYYVLEMLAYRLYNRITELSFRVRPVMLTYADSERDRVDGPHFAFLIEDDRLVGNRHGLDKLELDEASPRQFSALQASRFALFQYLIGNTDFSPLSSAEGDCCHNAKLIGEEESLDPLHPVPYDFDSSGWVDAHYAVPPAQLSLRDVTERQFRGFCAHNEGLEPARQEFLAARDDLVAIVEAEPRLSVRRRGTALRYLDDFFEVLTDDREFERRIIDECRS
ncbi:MAG: hypothetical protein V2J10_01720 [Wenzhouxiangella sp.]|jgi:hypothetical protein|nr:hypothetical protein [Wenzhouxiangella sp.]